MIENHYDDSQTDSMKAISGFVYSLLVDVYDAGVDTVQHELAEGPRSPKKQPVQSRWHAWYSGLPGTQQELVQEIVQEAAKATLFHMLVLLDNMSVGWPVNGMLSDYALYVQTYGSQQAIREDRPESRTRLNHPVADDVLHDLFLYAFQDRENPEQGPSSEEG